MRLWRAFLISLIFFIVICGVEYMLLPHNNSAFIFLSVFTFIICFFIYKILRGTN